MGLRIKNFTIMGVHWKIRFLEGVHKNQYIGRNFLKRGRGLGLFADLGEARQQKRRGGVFEGGEVLVPQWTLCFVFLWKSVTVSRFFDFYMTEGPSLLKCTICLQLFAILGFPLQFRVSHICSWYNSSPLWVFSEFSQQIDLSKFYIIITFIMFSYLICFC